MEPVATDTVSQNLEPLRREGGRAGPDLQRGFLARVAPGVALSAAIAWAAVQLGGIGWLQSNGIGPLTVAMILGMLVGNTVYPQWERLGADGLGFSKKRLLRLGIILYGFRLTFQDVAHVGMTGVLIDAVVVCATFAFAMLVGSRFLGIDRQTAMLVGIGHSICGATAVMAAEPVVRGSPAQVSVAVATVALFGTIATFVYPALYHFNLHYHWVELSQSAYGVYVGSTVHEVAQVVAAGRSISDEAADTAVISKMVRVMMLAPFLIALSAYLCRKAKDVDTGGQVAEEGADVGKAAKGGIMIPWFAIVFTLVVGLNSLISVPASGLSAIATVDNVLLATAMAAVGLTTQVSAFRKAGMRPLILAAILFAWLIFVGYMINAGLYAIGR